MKKALFMFALAQITLSVLAQKTDTIPILSGNDIVITNLKEDTVLDRNRAALALRLLKNGTVIVRLKTNQKSVDAYRKAGKGDIADQIEKDRRLQNEKIYYAFKSNFQFCKVLFIYAHQTTDFLKGNRKVFLNEKLQVDSSIVFNSENYVFCEYGSAESFSKFDDLAQPGLTKKNDIFGRTGSSKIFDTIPTQTSTSPATTNGLFFSDKNLKQFHRPFPFVEAIYLDNYNATVRDLSRQMDRAYGRLVVSKDFKDIKYQEKKKKK